MLKLQKGNLKKPTNRMTTNPTKYGSKYKIQASKKCYILTTDNIT
jgi:hypothetical protein